MTRRHVRFVLTGAVLAPVFLAVTLAQQAGSTPKTPAKAPAKTAPATTPVKSGAPVLDAAGQAKVKDAMSAAPTAVSKNATIMDWGADPMKDPPKQLRAGTNGWVCYPSMRVPGMDMTLEDPMCIDKQWQSWAEAYMGHTAPKVSGTGFAYMLRGDGGVSNVNPYDTAPSATNQWVVAPAHIMVLYADTKMLDSFPTDPTSGGPWVMWKGTPYAHLMVPVSASQAAKMSSGMAAMPGMAGMKK
jgi:hypothetical protein